MSGRFRIEGTFLRSAVARRVLLLFVLAAFVPSALMALMGWSQVSDVVAQHVQRQLDQTASSFGRSLYDRLLAAELVLSETVRQVRAGRTVLTQAGSASADRFFRGITLVRGSERKAVLGRPVAPGFTLPRGGIEQLRTGATLLLEIGSRPIMAIALDSGDPDAGVLLAEPHDEFLWGDADMLPPQAQICAVDDKAVVINCTDPMLAPLAVQLARSQGVAADANGTTYNVGRWNLFLKPHFGSGDWTFLAFQPREVGQESVARIARTFAGVALLTVLLVALLSMVQIRRILGPIERLIDATRQLRRGRLDKPLQIERDDEFGQLAQSFNGMANQLAFQFDSLKALSDIDGQILAHVDIEQIIGAAQSRLLQFDNLPCVGVFVVDRDATDGGTLYLRQSAEKSMTSVRVPLERESLDAGAGHDGVIWFDADSKPLPTFAVLLLRMGAQRCGVIAVGEDKELKALLCIGAMADAKPGADVLQHARALGERIVIAMTSTAREEQLVYQARHDALTRLPNRLLLLDRMTLELAHARREKSRLAVMFIDLDRFKNINDVYGHPAGDELLTTVGDRLRACVRESDTVARLGGDEFVVMLSAVQNVRDVAQVANQVLRFVSLPMTIEGKEQVIGASIGVAIAPDDGADPATLLKHADIAMYRAKEGGRGRFVFFEERMNSEVVERANIERELRLAVLRKQLSVVYQPRVCIATGRLRGVEALVRWKHPEFGDVPPTRFIPIAEDIGAIEEIGSWVLRTACDQAAAWRAAGVDIDTVSVNVSGAQLLAPEWVQSVKRALERSELPAGKLELEVTENVLLNNEEAAIAVLREIKELGVRLALDDFGTGYSSMGYLRRMPVDVMKIDRTFIADLEHDESSRGIARAMIAMARSLRLSVVAEGIESEGQADMLREWACDEAQGFFYSEPVDPDTVARLATRDAARKPALGAARAS